MVFRDRPSFFALKVVMMALSHELHFEIPLSTRGIT
jgi:hypothetical protein